MFNFNLQNKAFEELNAEQFRLVYFLNNTLSMVNETTKAANNNTIEMFNGYMMDKLGLSVRQIQRLIKSVEDAGYIIVDRAKTKKQPNKITIISATNSDKNSDKNVTLNNNATINSDKNVTLNNNATINCDKNSDKNGDKNVTLNKNEIRNNKNIYTCIHEHGDLETKVTEDKKENIIKEKVNEMRNVVLNEMEREDKVTITHDHPSSLIEDKMSCVSDCNVYIPKNTDNSPTSHSEDDMDFDTYTSMDLKNRGIKERQRTTSIMSVNKGAGDVENTPMDNLSTSTEKTQQDAKEVAKTQCDERIASIKSDINLDKDCMLKAKTQIQFDAYFGDFKAKLNQLKTILPIEEFNTYRAIQGKWWNATVQYLKFYKDPKQPKQPQQPTTVEMEYYRYHIESMFIAKSVEQMEKAINQISNWFDKMERSYSSSVMKKYEERFENDCVRVAHTNPIFKEWQNKATGEAQAA